MARLSILEHGTVSQIHRQFERRITAEEAVKLHRHPKVWDAMLDAMRQHPAFRLVHGRFTLLADKIAMVKMWPGVNPADVDAAFITAMEDGTITLYNAELGKNPLLDLVITVYRESFLATLCYARGRMEEALGDEYGEWGGYDSTQFVLRVKAIKNAKPFIPNRIVIELVDFGANRDRENGLKLETVQKAQASRLADFAVIYGAAQSPEWVRQMDGQDVPYAIAGGLLLDTNEEDAWHISPDVSFRGLRPLLHYSEIADTLFNSAVPILRQHR